MVGARRNNQWQKVYLINQVESKEKIPGMEERFVFYDLKFTSLNVFVLL